MIDATRRRPAFPFKLAGGFFLLIVTACLVQTVWQAVDPKDFAAFRAQEAADRANRIKLAALEDAKARSDRNAYLLANPGKASLEEGENLRHYGHFWGQTSDEIDADKAWDEVEAAKSNYVPVGTDYRPYNARLIKAYRSWETLELKAYGRDWKRYWQENHAGDGLTSCPAMAKSGMPEAECYKAEWSKGEVEPLGPMLMHCNSGEGIIPTDEGSCRAHAAASTTEALAGLDTAKPSAD